MSETVKTLRETKHDYRDSPGGTAHGADNTTDRNSITRPITTIATDLRDPVPDAANPRNATVAVHALSKQVCNQIISLNPLKSAYLELYFGLEYRQDKTLAVLGAVLAVTAGVPLPIIFVIFSKIIDNFPPTEDELRTRLSQLLGVAAAYFVITTGYTCIFSRVGERIALTSRERLLRCLLELEQGYFDTHEVNVTGLLTSKVETIQVGTSEKAGIFIQSMSYLVAAFIVGFTLNPKLTGILLAAVIPVTVLIVKCGSDWLTKLSKAASTNIEAAAELAEASLRAVQTVQAYNFSEAICSQYCLYLDAATGTIIKKQIVSACMLGCLYFVAYATNGLAFYVGSILSSTDSSQAGTIYAVCLLILDASFVLGQFATFLHIFANAASAGKEIRALITVSKKSAAERQQTDREIFDIRGLQLAANGVTFAYPARPEQDVLDSIDIRLEPGCLNAVVGTSGGGKSTLISLLLGVYKDYSGTIMVGDKDLKHIDVANLRSQISIVDQECVLFTGSVFDNIRYGIAGVSLAAEDLRLKCAEAMIAAGVDFMDRLPNGIDTIIDNSLQLSGGQKQRICLARALMKRPAILILDEPTSALDAKSEALIAKTVKRVAEAGTMVIMIAHRLSTVLDAGKVFVFDAGKVVESGSPADLIVPGTIFYNLLASQYGGEIPIAADSQQSPWVKVDELSIDTLGDNFDEKNNHQLQRTASMMPSGPEQLLRSLLKQERWLIGAGIISSTITGCIIVGEAVSFGNLVQLLNAGDYADGRGGIGFFCLIFFILACIALLTYSTSGSAFGLASSRFTKSVQVRMLRNLLRQDMTWFSRPGHSVHDLMARLSTDTGNLSSLSGVALGTIFTIAASMVGGIVLSFAIAWRIAIVLVSCVPVLAAAGYTRVRVLARSEESQRNAYNEAAGIAAESCRNIRTVTTLGLQQVILEKYHNALTRPYKHRLHFTIMSSALLAFSFAITYFVYALAYWWGSNNVREGYYGSKEFFIVLPALLFSAQSAGQAFSLSPEITKAKSAAKSMSSLLNAQPSILRQPIASKEVGSNSILSSEEKHEGMPKLEFRQVSMSYKHKNSPTLRNVSFAIEQGETVALVGPSGAGKSTVIALLERFYEVSAGTLLIDGVDIREHDPCQLRACIGLVSQEPHFFPGSIRHNLAMSSALQDEGSTKQIQAACAKVGLHDFILSLPEGYDTECSSATSTKLSGGQQQRLSIARALIRDPQILLLDEPTSALDAHTERDVQEALELAASGRTTLIVAHRLSSIKHVDRIIVFDRGRIAEMGTHAELMQNKALYASMANAQALS